MPTWERVGKGWKARQMAGGGHRVARRWIPLQGSPEVTDEPHLCGEQEWDLREGWSAASPTDGERRPSEVIQRGPPALETR